MTPAQQKNFHFYKGDICLPEDCKKALQGVDYVLHQAALGSVPRSIKTPELTHETNSTGFLNILIAAKDANVKRFVYASSSSVYGDSPDLPRKKKKKLAIHYRLMQCLNILMNYMRKRSQIVME